VSEPAPTLSFLDRFVFAWSCFFRVLFDPAFAGRAFQVRDEPKALPGPESKRAPESKRLPDLPATTSALQLLSMLQREGRLVDFLEQDIASFSDAEIGSVVRVVHDGCRKALREHVRLAPVRAEEEGKPVTLPAGYSPAEVKLSGNVQGSAPYKGVLRHRGWKAIHVSLPTPVKGHDPNVIAPAEVEL
jgi:hypothetical protein